MRITLSNLPAEGKEFKVSTKDKEVQEKLQEFIGTAEFSSCFTIFPTGNSYQITGYIESTPLLPCSFCGEDIQQALKEDFNEQLMTSLCKDLHKANSPKERLEISGEIVPGLTENHLDISEFLREFIGLAIPYQVKCELNSQGQCTGCGLNITNKEHLKNQEDNGGHPSFQALKKLKLN